MTVPPLINRVGPLSLPNDEKIAVIMYKGWGEETKL